MNALNSRPSRPLAFLWPAPEVPSFCQLLVSHASCDWPSQRQDWKALSRREQRVIMFRDLLHTRKAFAWVLFWHIVREVKAKRCWRPSHIFLLRTGCFSKAGSASTFAKGFADSISRIDPQIFITITAHAGLPGGMQVYSHAFAKSSASICICFLF